jgi:hypothetical protein
VVVAQVPQPPAEIQPFQAPPAQATPVPQAAPIQPPPAPLRDLNINPNATIDQLGQPAPPTTPPPAPPAQRANANFAARGATAGAFASAPMMFGDLFGGSFAGFGGSQTIFFNRHSAGTILAGSPGASGSILAFEFGSDSVPNDVFTTGSGSDFAGADGFADTFSIAEPLPPNDALTSPGPGFTFDGGTAVYTDSTAVNTAQPGIYSNGEQWFISYSYTQSLDNSSGGEPIRPVPGPGVAARRVKISENFSPEVRDRFFGSYNFFNDAFGGLGDISRYTIGFERLLVEDLISIEARLPMAGTYSSSQNLDRQASRDFELGNAALIGKAVLLRTDSMIFSGGVGVTVPFADDTRISSGGQPVLVVENETVHLLPFLGLLVRHSRDTSVQGFIQLDVATNGDPVFGNLAGGPLPKLGVFNDSTLLELDGAVSHVLYRNRNRNNPLQQVIGNSELHYTGTLQESDFVSRGTLTYTNLKRHFNVLNATTGLHLVMSNNLVVSPAMSIPLRDGLDEQFDYEAILQVNYLR